MYGLQTVPHVRQRTRYDNGHRIVDVSGLHLLFDIDGNDFSLQSGILFFFWSACYSLSFSLRFLCPAWPERIPAPPFSGRKHRTLPLIFYIRTVRINSDYFFARSKTADLRSLFSSLGSDESIVSPRLSKTSENTFYKHTKIAFIRRISNFGPNKITRSRKFFHRTHHFQPFSAVLTTSKKIPRQSVGEFQSRSDKFYTSRPIYDRQHDREKYTTGSRSTRTRRNSPHRKCGATPRER